LQIDQYLFFVIITFDKNIGIINIIKENKSDQLIFNITNINKCLLYFNENFETDKKLIFEYFKNNPLDDLNIIKMKKSKWKYLIIKDIFDNILFLNQTNKKLSDIQLIQEFFPKEQWKYIEEQNSIFCELKIGLIERNFSIYDSNQYIPYNTYTSIFVDI